MYRYLSTAFLLLALLRTCAVPVAKAEDIIRTDTPTVFDDLLLISTIDGYLRAIEPHTGAVKWSLKEDPVLVSPKTIQHGFTFLPDPQDGGLYVLKDGQLKKLPYSIPQLVTASPCRTTDGVLYAGSKRDVWLEIDPNTGLKLDELSQSQTERQCPLSKNTTVFIGRSEYKLTMVDPENRDRRWNATFTDYSSHLLPADPSYPYQHFTSTMDGRLVTVNGAEGIVSWELDVGNTVVAMYTLQKDGLHKLPYTVIGKETLEGLVKDPWQNVVRAWIDDVSQARPTVETAASRHLFPTLYVGESSYGLFAMPAFVDGHTVTIAPKYLGPPLLEGPTPIAVKSEEPQQRSNPSARPIALIDLNVAKITHKTVDGEFLVLGYHEPPQLAAASQLIPRRPIRQLYPSLPFINIERQPGEESSSVGAVDARHHSWAVYGFWADNRVAVMVAASSTVLIFVISCWILCEKLRDRQQRKQLLLEQQWQQQQQQQEAKYAQTTRSLGNFWHAHRMQQQLPDGWLRAGNIAYNPEDRLGHGCEGTVVFRGKFDGREVAVKRVIADIRVADREADLLRESDAHPNVIRYFCMESDSNFRYIALELCDYSLFDYVESGEIRTQCSLSAMDILHQATKGLAYLHSINIVHRDMKPQNVLLSRSSSGAVRALISDFGLCKRLQAGRNSLSRRSGLTGTDGWIAPEALASDASVTCAVDVFSLGCIYYYVLTTGKHPFGDVLKRQANIMQGEYSLKLLTTTGDIVGVALIESMIRRDPDLRPSSATLSVHPFFWTKERQLQFFMDVSDRIEKLDEQSVVIRRLEDNAHRAVGYNWRQTICPALAEDLRKFRTYRGNTVRDLLRAMRNKKHHYRELPPEVRQSLGHVPEQFVTYFTSRFPQLLQHTYQAMICCANEHAFVGYYSEEARKLADQLGIEKNEVEGAEIVVAGTVTDNRLRAETVGASGSAAAGEEPDESNAEWIEVGAPKISQRQAGNFTADAAGNLKVTGNQIRKRKKHYRNKADTNRQPHNPPH